MKIGGLQKLTLIDYPGTLACTVFLSGCNFRCPWCYSSELVLPEKIAQQPILEEKDFFEFLKQRKCQLDGVVVCGGEPTINSDLPRFLQRIKKFGYKIKLDTNGSNPQMLESVLKQKLVDYIAMDIKAPREKYSQVIGFEGSSGDYLLSLLQKSIDLLKKNIIDYEFRTTFVPGLLDKQDILAIAQWLKPAKRYFLQNFRPEKTLNPSFSSRNSYSMEEAAVFFRSIAPFFEVVQVR